MKILFAAGEAVPFCKTGGLADVMGDLPQTLAAAGETVAMILPLHRSVREKFSSELEYIGYTYVDLAWRHEYCGVFRCERLGVTYFFIDNMRYFDRGTLYNEFDNAERYAFFCRAVLSSFDLTGFRPELIHCNDWQAALIPVYIADENARSDYFKGIRTVFTIHNAEYQGRFGAEVLTEVFGLNEGWMADGTLDFDGGVNLMKGAILTADAVTTVSPSYARELMLPAYAHGLDGVLCSVSHKLYGVLNGIDMLRFDPATDAALAVNYSADDPAGKKQDKAALQQRLGLPVRADVPLIAMVSRLVAHKGLDLICEVGEQLVGDDVQLAVLGTGESGYEQYFEDLHRRYGDKVAFCCGYDAALAQMMYAGADLFLMPSKSEPCGLSQLIAMRYGAVPVVRETGGLRDTVHAYEAWCGRGNGFSFAAYNAGDMLHVIREGCELYRHEPERFACVQQAGMRGDHSWDRSAKAYMDIYRHISGNK